MDTCSCEFYRCHDVITNTYMPLVVTTNDTVTNVKIISGTFSGAWIISELSLIVIQTTATENHHSFSISTLPATHSLFIALIISVRLSCSVSANKLGRGLTYTSHRKY